MHVVQVNFLPAPEGCPPNELFERWPSLADIPEAAAAGGVRVSAIQAAASDALISQAGVDYRFVDVRALATARDRGRHIASLLHDMRADVVHVHGLGFARTAAAVRACMPRTPILIQDHADRPPRWWKRAPWRQWYACADGIAFTAAEQAEPFTRARLFAADTRLFTIPESTSRFRPGDVAGARLASGLHGDPCIVSVGHLSPHKGTMAVLDGVARAAECLPGLQLWCAFGKAPLLADVRRRIADDPRLAERVHLLGQVPHGGIETLMRAADLFVSGSLRESSGYAMLEAMACGATPVVTDIPAFRVLTGGARIGALWPCGDAGALAGAIVRMTADRPGRAHVRAHFDASLSFPALGRQWAAAYASLLPGARRHDR